MIKFPLNTSKKTKIILILTSVVILVAGAIAAIVMNRNPHRATEIGILPSVLSIQVQESGIPMKGLIGLGGDCGSDYFPTQDGSVSCLMDVSTKKSTIEGYYEINGISVQSFVTKKRITLPLQPRTSGNQPVYVQQDRLVNLLVNIGIDGSVTMKIKKNGELVNLPSQTGLELP